MCKIFALMYWIGSSPLMARVIVVPVGVFTNISMLGANLCVLCGVTGVFGEATTG
jgi:hypothetical protein